MAAVGGLVPADGELKSSCCIPLNTAALETIVCCCCAGRYAQYRYTVRLDLFLGEDVGLDLVLVDPLGLVLGDLLDLGGVVSSAGAKLKLGYCRKSDMAAGWCL